MLAQIDSRMRSRLMLLKRRERVLGLKVIGLDGSILAQGLPFFFSTVGITICNNNIETSFLRLFITAEKLFQISIHGCTLSLQDLKFLANSKNLCLLSLVNCKFVESNINEEFTAEVFSSFSSIGVLSVTSEQISRKCWEKTANVLRNRHCDLVLKVNSEIITI
jgi:hypothetical protein